MSKHKGHSIVFQVFIDKLPFGKQRTAFRAGENNKSLARNNLSRGADRIVETASRRKLLSKTKTQTDGHTHTHTHACTHASFVLAKTSIFHRYSALPIQTPC